MASTEHSCERERKLDDFATKNSLKTTPDFVITEKNIEDICNIKSDLYSVQASQRKTAGFLRSIGMDLGTVLVYPGKKIDTEFSESPVTMFYDRRNAPRVVHRILLETPEDTVPEIISYEMDYISIHTCISMYYFETACINIIKLMQTKDVLFEGKALRNLIYKIIYERRSVKEHVERLGWLEISPEPETELIDGIIAEFSESTGKNWKADYIKFDDIEKYLNTRVHNIEKKDHKFLPFLQRFTYSPDCELEDLLPYNNLCKEDFFMRMFNHRYREKNSIVSILAGKTGLLTLLIMIKYPFFVEICECLPESIFKEEYSFDIAYHAVIKSKPDVLRYIMEKNKSVCDNTENGLKLIRQCILEKNFPLMFDIVVQEFDHVPGKIFNVDYRFLRKYAMESHDTKKISHVLEFIESMNRKHETVFADSCFTADDTFHIMKMFPHGSSHIDIVRSFLGIITDTVREKIPPVMYGGTSDCLQKFICEPPVDADLLHRYIKIMTNPERTSEHDYIAKSSMRLSLVQYFFKFGSLEDMKWLYSAGFIRNDVEQAILVIWAVVNDKRELFDWMNHEFSCDVFHMHNELPLMFACADHKTLKYAADIYRCHGLSIEKSVFYSCLEIILKRKKMTEVAKRHIKAQIEELFIY